jgi:hypothetical protein
MLRWGNNFVCGENMNLGDPKDRIYWGKYGSPKFMSTWKLNVTLFGNTIFADIIKLR